MTLFAFAERVSAKVVFQIISKSIHFRNLGRERRPRIGKSRKQHAWARIGYVSGHGVF